MGGGGGRVEGSCVRCIVSVNLRENYEHDLTFYTRGACGGPFSGTYPLG